MKVCLACGQRFEADNWLCPDCGKSPSLLNGYLSFSPDMAETNDGFSAKYFAQLAKLEESSFWFRSRNNLLIWALRRYFPHIKNFLEIGCGTGFVLSGIQRHFPGLKLSGSEIFSEGLDFARKRLPDVNLFQLDARRIPFEDEFDVIGAFDVLEHIDEDELVLLQIFRATKQDGGIILTVPQHRFLWSKVDEYSFHKRRYARKEIVGKVEGAGFRIIRVTSFVFFLLPLMMFSRMRQRRSQSNFNPIAEYKAGYLLNITLEKVLGIERALIGRGLSFPAGGSLLIIAAKK